MGKTWIGAELLVQKPGFQFKSMLRLVRVGSEEGGVESRS